MSCGRGCFTHMINDIPPPGVPPPPKKKRHTFCERPRTTIFQEQYLHVRYYFSLLLYTEFCYEFCYVHCLLHYRIPKIFWNSCSRLPWRAETEFSKHCSLRPSCPYRKWIRTNQSVQCLFVYAIERSHKYTRSQHLTLDLPDSQLLHCYISDWKSKIPK